jgi:hypothetical protein
MSKFEAQLPNLVMKRQALNYGTVAESFNQSMTLPKLATFASKQRNAIYCKTELKMYEGSLHSSSRTPR